MWQARNRENGNACAPRQLQAFRISIPDSEVPGAAGVPRIEQQIQDRLAAMPGVSSVAFSSAVPVDGNNWFDSVLAADHACVEGAAPPHRAQQRVSQTAVT